MAGEYLVGIWLSRRPLRADTQPFFLPLGQNSTLYVKEMSNIHWEDRVLSLISIKLIRVVRLRTVPKKVSVPGEGQGLAAGSGFSSVEGKGGGEPWAPPLR